MKKFVVSLLICSSFIFVGCSNEKLSTKQNGNNSTIEKSEQSSKDLIQGYWESSSDQAPTLEIDGTDVIVGVGWSQFWTGETGVFENTATLNKNEIVGTDSDSGDEFLFKYEIKAKRLVLTVSKNWTPSVFEESDDKDDLTFKEGQKFIFNKKKKPKDAPKKTDSTDSDEETEDDSLLKEGDYPDAGEYLVGEDIKPGTYDIDQLYGNNGKINVSGREYSIPADTIYGVRVILKENDIVTFSGDPEENSGSVTFSLNEPHQ
nr:MAG TPA: Lysis protein [Caudoviricetes sp.]